MSLTFSSPVRSVLPLRLSIIQAPNLRPPGENEEEGDETEPPDASLSPAPLLSPNATQRTQNLTTLAMSIESHQHSGIGWNALWILLLGIVVGLLISALAFFIYQRRLQTTATTLNKRAPYTSSIESSFDKFARPSGRRSRSNASGSKSALSNLSGPDPSQNQLLDSTHNGSDSSRTSSGTGTASTTSSSYDQNTVV